MDYSTDAMGNYMGDYAPVDPYAQETEEEKRLRLQREADEAARAQAAATPVKETRIIDPRTGEVKLKIEGNERDLSAANPNTPTVVKPGDYNAYTARQESGANPNIGYHYPANAQGQRRSSAYGTYGITAPAYKDIQAANPAFANRPLESLTTEEQTQANETYRGVLGQQLQAKGVEPTEENTRLAHLLGAQGAARYLQNKTVSNQAAAANGGPERLKQIAEARRLGQPAPASGAAVAQQQPAPAVPVQPQNMQPPAEPAPAVPVNPEQAMAPGSTYSLAQGGGQPGITVPGMNVPLTEGTQLPMAQQRFQNNQDNLQELLAMRNDTSMPEHLRQRSADRAYELLNNERQMTAAEQKFQALVASGDGKAIANAVQGRGAKGEEGSFLKMIALGFISPELAGAEAIKLGLGPTKYEQSTIANADGTQTAIEIKKGSDGRIQAAYRMDGTPLTTQELNRLNSGVNLDIVGGSYVNDTTGEVGRLVSDKKTGITYVQTDKGRKPMTGFRPQSSGGSLDMQRATQIQRQNIDLATDWAKLQMKIQGAAPEAANKYLGEFNAKHRVNFGLSSLSGAAPQISLETGQMISTPAPTVTSTTPTVGTGTTTGTTVGGKVTGGGSPAGVEQALELSTEAAKKDIQVQGARSESFNKYVDETITPDAINGDSIASTRKQQFELFNRPGVDVAKIFGVASGAGSAPGDQRWTMFRDILIGKVSKPEDEIRQRAAALGLNPQEQSVAVEYAIMNADINSKTLKSTAGSAQVSDAEQKLNQARNVDITKVPMLGGYNAMAQSQFAGDLAKYRGDWATTVKAGNTAELERLWRREKDGINKLYLDSAKQRVEYIAKMGSTAAAIKEGYKLYPVPRYDPTLNNGQGGWINKKPIGNYER